MLYDLSCQEALWLSENRRAERKPNPETVYKIGCALDVDVSAIVKEIEYRLAAA